VALKFIYLQINGFIALICMMVYGKLATTTGPDIINVMMARNGSTQTGSNMMGLQTTLSSLVLILMASCGLRLV
jgi:hypothetical protein